MLQRFLCGLLLTASLLGAAPKKPKLVVAIVVDQFRYDYLTRFRADYTSGLDTLLKTGAVFTSAGEAPAGLTCSRGVPKAADTVDAVPLTGSKMLPGSGVPTVRPSLRSVADTCAITDRVGPYTAANCDEVR